MHPGDTLAYFHQRALEVHGPDTPALAMGGCNCEPFDPSLIIHALKPAQGPLRRRRQLQLTLLSAARPLI